MNPYPELLLAVASAPPPGQAQISLTEALLVLCFGGLLMAAYQLSRVAHRLKALERRSATTAHHPGALSTSNSGSAGEATLPPHILAAIVAACEDEFDVPIRIVSITSGAEQKQVWSMEGRRQIFASHQVR
jgi:hypothetical protein